MGLPLPQQLRIPCAFLGALGIVTFALRCFIMHMWYTGTLLTGIHYGTGQRTSEISVTDSVHAMRCWWLCFLAYACSITLAKISAGFFFLRATGSKPVFRITTYVITILAAVVGFGFFFLSVFQCLPVSFFWTRLHGDTNGKCLDIEIMIIATYFYGAVTAGTDIAWGILVGALIWKLQIDRRTKILTAPFLGLACIASYAALVRMPYVANFRKPDFLYATVEISMWSTIEVGVSICAANLATIRPLIHHFTHKGESWESRQNRPGHAELATIPDDQELATLKIPPPKTAESSISSTDPKGNNGESGITRSVSNWSRWTRKDSAANVDIHVP
ncbi:hypothetical protein COCCADRAFT_105845 [Bipolaris zeicola 26-R-13]|uniref:Rhodopsin domain-containing protein n=1 Tax=Cochliobolus carbonum (strain 26-R-13) TaxID=930089 RepID=W6XVF7_COCC2|nr:uncharacterized protein COCCADRAFT_105845 [Bipolaris zeicola 26-R-13]EUC29708.1 hypothetical protein COCCADRAFT_105845 [Bipolaris zeicola 26-R-13]